MESMTGLVVAMTKPMGEGNSKNTTKNVGGTGIKGISVKDVGKNVTNKSKITFHLTKDHKLEMSRRRSKGNGGGTPRCLPENPRNGPKSANLILKLKNKFTKKKIKKLRGAKIITGKKIQESDSSQPKIGKFFMKIGSLIKGNSNGNYPPT